jgi:hypothetical protein
VKRAPFYEVAPTPTEVRAAWSKARPDSLHYQRRLTFSQRAFLQGVVQEFLRQEVLRAANTAAAKAYAKPTAALRRAIEVTRAWLEFGDPLNVDPAEDAP